MNEREMLEFAANAAGYDVELEYYGKDRHGLKSGKIGIPPHIWNPLTDDGDAFRLMVRLKMDINDCGYASEVYIDKYELCVCEVYGIQTPEAATRRAIVRAAAEIGKTMHNRSSEYG